MNSNKEFDSRSPEDIAADERFHATALRERLLEIASRKHSSDTSHPNADAERKRRLQRLALEGNHESRLFDSSPPPSFYP